MKPRYRLYWRGYRWICRLYTTGILNAFGYVQEFLEQGRIVTGCKYNEESDFWEIDFYL